MRSFRKVKRSLYLAFLILGGCATSSFRIAAKASYRTELDVSPDRVVAKCEDISGDFEYHMFLLYVLDDANTVVLVIQSNNLDRESCFDRVNATEKILSSGKHITISGMGSLNEPRVLDQENYFFPKHGTFHRNGRSLQFMAINNEKGLCYSAYHGDDKPCPRDEFPIAPEDRL